MGGKLHCRWRSLAAQLAIFGLLLRGVLAAIMLPMPLLAPSAGQASPVGNGPIPICTGSQLKLSSLNQGDGLTDEPGTSHPCQICDALAAAAYAVEPIEASVRALMSPSDVMLPADRRGPVGAAGLAHRNRSPPRPA